MFDKTALIILAHSNRGALMSSYSLLDSEGYFVAPCFSESDLLMYCSRYKPELVITSDPLFGTDGSRLIESIKKRSMMTRILLLPEGGDPTPGGEFAEPAPGEEVVRLVETLRVPAYPVRLN